GVAQIVTFLYEFEDSSQLKQVRAFAKTHQFDTIIFTSASFNNYDLAIGQHLREIVKSKDCKTNILEYREHLDQLKLQSCCLALITFKNSGKYRFKQLYALESTKFSNADVQKYLQEFYNQP